MAEMLTSAGVVQPRHGGTGQACTAKRKHIVGGVVQQETDMGRTARIKPRPVERCKAL